MPVTEESVVIPRPPSEVWDFLSKAHNWPSWENSILECEQITDGELGVGTRWRGVNRLLGKKVDWVTEFTECEPQKLISGKAVDSKIGFVTTSRLDEADGGTRFTYRLETESGLGGIFGKLADPIVAAAYARVVRASLDNLTDLLTAES
ncbi:MAG: SRPBCC family protein [Rhodococcus sp. (in: high G+C Gram-positive bacteria)]|uniref:SRPBCC family protein n=1 Tax=Rhodococcus sp. TaxID=1831 RepID=UPI003BB7E71A